MPTKRDNSIIVEETVNNLRRLFQVVNEQSKTTASDTGLTGSQLWALKALYEEVGKQTTVSALADRICLNSSTVVRLLDGLEQRAFVQRERAMSDRRRVYVRLTEKGCRLIRESPEVGQTILSNSLNTLSENKLQAIASGLNQLITIIDSQKKQHEKQDSSANSSSRTF